MRLKRDADTIANRYRFALALAVMVAACYPATASVSEDLSDINASFICPQALASDGERKAAMTALSRRLAALHLSYAQGQRVLQTMMSVHACGGADRKDGLQAEIGPAASIMP